MNKERYRIRFSMKAEGEEAEVMIYSDIANDKWWGDETTPTDFDKALKEARKNGANKLNVRINSGGGPERILHIRRAGNGGPGRRGA